MGHRGPSAPTMDPAAPGGRGTTPRCAPRAPTALVATAWTLTTRRHARSGLAEPRITTCEPYGPDRSADIADSAAAQTQ